MAYTASRTSKGFERIGNKFNLAAQANEYEMTPSLALVEGDMVVLTNGKVAKAAANATNVLGVCAETKTADATAVTKIRVYDNPFDIFRCTFADHADNVADSGTTTTIVDTELSMSADSDCLGAYLWFYEGPNKGQARTVSGFAQASDTITFIDPVGTAITTADKYILLGECDEAGASTINVGRVGVDLKDENTIDANAPVDAVDGPLVCLKIIPEDLMMDVMIIKHLYNSR